MMENLMEKESPSNFRKSQGSDAIRGNHRELQQPQRPVASKLASDLPKPWLNSSSPRSPGCKTDTAESLWQESRPGGLLDALPALCPRPCCLRQLQGAPGLPRSTDGTPQIQAKPLSGHEETSPTESLCTDGAWNTDLVFRFRANTSCSTLLWLHLWKIAI